MIPVFTKGIPIRITPADIKKYHGEVFPELLDGKDELLFSAIEDTYTMWYGVNTIWDNMQEQEYFDKTRLCFRLLVCWYITDQYPQYAVGVPTMGAMPIKRKKIGSVDITFQDLAMNSTDVMTMLNTNAFGKKALLMIRTSVKRRLLRVST